MTVTAHDFTRPLQLAPTLRAKLTQWLGRAVTLSMEQLNGMSVPVEMSIESCTTAFPFDSLSQWSEKSLAYQVSLDGIDSNALIAIPNPLIQEVVGRMLGEQPTTQAAERDLTPAESSVAQFVVETLVKNLNEGWPGDSPLDLTVRDVEPNLRRTRQFRPTEAIIECRNQVKTALGTSYWSWFVSIDFLYFIFGLPPRSQRPSKVHSSRQLLESLIRSMQTELVIQLGSVQLSGPQLAALRVGDLVVLDQRVSEPLRATVRGEPKFLGWAGRIGDRQAFEVESEIPPARTVIAQPESAAATVSKQ